MPVLSTKKSNINFCYREYDVQKGNIYKITNIDTGKIYIGSTKFDIEKRFQEHLDGKGAVFTKKYQPLNIEKIYEVDCLFVC